MTNPPPEIAAERHAEYWADDKPTRFVMPDEPAELVAQCEANATARAHAEVKCAACGEPRRVHGWKANEFRVKCRFVEPPTDTNLKQGESA